jgi:site-specific DNA-methyltransferase (adenine-specific)
VFREWLRGKAVDGGLFLGNCLDVLPGLPEGCVDFVCADPPYGSTHIEWDRPLYLPSLWRQLRRVLSHRGVVLLTATQPYASELIFGKREWYRYAWYWEKPKGANFARTATRPLSVVEECLVFCESDYGFTYNSQRDPLAKPYTRKWPKPRGGPSAGLQNDRYKEKDYTHATPRNLLYASADGEKSLHPCQKPVNLITYFVRTYTNPGDLALDFCMGSGTTGVACVREGRRFVGVEADRQCFQVGSARIRNELNTGLQSPHKS